MTKKRAEELLAQLDPEQRAVAQHAIGPLVVRAGAGTGKTRAITYRIAYAIATGVYGMHDVLAVTFTARAASEMRERLRTLGVGDVQARTFHSAALRQLSYFWSTAIGGSMLPLMEHKASLVAAAAASIGVSNDRAAVRDLAAEIEWTKVSLISPEEYPQRVAQLSRTVPAGLGADEFQRILASYERVKNDRGVIDFEDVLLLLIGILESRPDIAQQIQRQYQHFVVDEYQDVSPLQQRLLDLWLGERKNLCVVGDAAQTIYSFAGASSSYLTNFQTRFPAARVIELNRDYRSTPQIVSVANQIVEQMRFLPSAQDLLHASTTNPQSAGKNQSPAEVTVKLIAQRPLGPAVAFDTYADDAAEAAGIAAHINKLVSAGTPLSRIAILYRTNSQSEEFINALTQAGISYQLRGGQAFFGRREIRQALTSLRTLAHSDPNLNVLEAVTGVVTSLSWSPTPPASRGAVRERWDALNALVEMAKDKSDLPTFVNELEERAAAQYAPTLEGVTLSTIHAAKGLEWEAVFVAGMAEGLMPIAQAKQPAEIEEERRLLYVAITRAQQTLRISWARARNDRKPNRKLSRFLTRSWPVSERQRTGENVSLAPRESQTQSARALTREFLRTADPQAVACFERLREWRSLQAQALQRAPFQIFPDVTLREIAQQQPQQLEQLTQIRGIGQVKLDQFGAAILAIIAGQPVTSVVSATTTALAEFNAADFSS